MRNETVDITVIGGDLPGWLPLWKRIDLEKGSVNRTKSYSGRDIATVYPRRLRPTYLWEQLSGPQYAERYIEQLADSSVEVMTDTMVTDLKPGKVMAQNPVDGIVNVNTKTVILSMGCRERTRNQIQIPGSRPSGIMTAGKAQYFLNLEGYLPGKKAVILGSGDIGLIMARRMHLEGIDVEGVYEVMPYPGGLQRNIEQCCTIMIFPLSVHDRDGDFWKISFEGVEVAQLDENRQPIEETRRYIPCDLLVLSRLDSENELSLLQV